MDDAVVVIDDDDIGLCCLFLCLSCLGQPSEAAEDAPSLYPVASVWHLAGWLGVTKPFVCLKSQYNGEHIPGIMAHYPVQTNTFMAGIIKNFSMGGGGAKI